MFYIGLYRESIKILSETKKPRALIWYVASPSGPLPSLFKFCPLGQKLLHPRDHMFYIGLYRENMGKKILS